jgi:dTMP kinase
VRAVSAPIFVSFEGIDGAGKSTQVERLKAFLKQRGRDVVVTREPGGTEAGERIRELLLDGCDISARTEAALFAAARAELVEAVIRPALAAGADVIVDRYLDSSLAYQGVARGLDLELLYAWNLHMVQDVLPVRTFLLELPAEDASLRLGAPDRLERESVVFRRKVEEAYRQLARRFADRIVEIDASASEEQVAALVREHVRQLLGSTAARAACS